MYWLYPSPSRLVNFAAVPGRTVLSMNLPIQLGLNFPLRSWIGAMISFSTISPYCRSLGLTFLLKALEIWARNSWTLCKARSLLSSIITHSSYRAFIHSDLLLLPLVRVWLFSWKYRFYSAHLRIKVHPAEDWIMVQYSHRANGSFSGWSI